MKNLLLMTILLFVYAATAQIELKKSSISTTGGTTTDGNKQVIFTVGEVNVQETDVGNTHLSEGFIGPDITEALGITDYGILSGISIYPNPVTDRFSVNLTQTSIYDFYLYDLQGKQIFSRQSQNIKESFDISRLTAAGYMLIIIDRQNKLKKSFKIIKE